MLIISLAVYAPIFASVKVVESTPSRLVLSWELSDFDTVSVGNKNIYRTRVSYRGGHALAGDSGAALIPAYTFYAGVPASGGIRVSVEPEEVSVVRLNHPLERRTFARDALEPAFAGASWISEPLYTFMREYRAAYLSIRPVYDMGQGSVRLLRRARIVVEFPPAAHSGASWEPRGDYERMVSRLILNYRAAQGWRERPALRKAASADTYPFSASSRLATFRVGDGNREYNETSTKENSLIRISGKRVRELLSGGGNIPINSVALYASHKGEMDIMPAQEGDVPAGVFEVPILRRDTNGNGVVDDDDYFIAYVSGSSDWVYGASEFNIAINRYDDRRTYWLTVKDGVGLTMGRFEQPDGAAAATHDYFEDNVYLRTPQELANKARSGGLDWVWRRYTMSRPDTTYTFDLPDADISHPASVRLTGSRGELGGRRITVRASLGTEVICAECSNDTRASVSLRSAGRQTFSVSVTTDTSANFYELDGARIRYRRPIQVPSSGRLTVFSSVNEGVTRYSVASGGADGQVAYIIRVPQDEREISFVNIDTVRQAAYTFNDEGNSGVRYMITLEKNIVDYSDSLTASPNRSFVNEGYRIRDLRSASNRADYLIVTHENFIDASRELAEHKANMGFANPRFVTIGDVMDQFGGGNTDPVALRNFLLHVYRRWVGGGDLSYVTLMGSGHYDYKQISSRAANFMPVMYINNILGDDYYTFFGASNPSVQHDGYFFLGRLPAKSAAEASNMVEKIIETEDPRIAEFDAWRNRVLLTADDDQQGPDRDGITNHVPASEDAAGTLMTMRPGIDLRKIYLFEYPWDDRYQKPAARRAFINEINNGVSVVSWFGHGAPDLVADERLFEISDVPALYNKKRYPLFCMFSCSIGKFDQPGGESVGTMLVGQPGAGAIAVLSSVREVLASHNRNLAQPFFEALFDSEANFTFGAAQRHAKSVYRNSDNRLYVLLGDPSISLTPRNLNVGLNITDDSGAPIDTLKALQQITIKGSVNRAVPLAKRAALKNLGGSGVYVNLSLFNPPETARRKDGGKNTNPEYSLPGSPVFSAKIPITDGKFEQRILLPMNLAFGKSGVRLSAYAWKEGEALSGTGFVDSLIFQGSESGRINDTTPPKISVRPVYDDESMDRAGMFVKNRVTAQLPLTLEVKIEDESGINTMGSGPDEGLTMEVKGALSKRSVNHLFQFSEGNFRQGVAMIQLEENTLKSGSHELVISAQDLLGNVSRQSVTIEIVDPADIKLDHVINVPNPVRMGRETRFYFYHSNTPGDFNVNVTIRVYTLGGRLLRVIRNPRNGEAWVPRDERGNLLTPNVYLYQVTASSPNIGRTVKSKIKKLVVQPPR